MRMLFEACAEDLKAHNPPLSNRFLTEWEVTVEEYEALCDFMSHSLDIRLIADHCAPVAVAA